VAVSDPPHLGWDAALAAADAALYKAKTGGRNRICTTTIEALAAEADEVRPERRTSAILSLRPEDHTAGA
jgi:hypothetical protein